ncbi:MAG: hypothetical protein AB1586_12885 [Pseudomonadota bacterium]
MKITTRSILRWTGATFLAALAPVLVLSATLDFMVGLPRLSALAFLTRFIFYVGVVLPFTLSSAVVLGLPAARFCLARRWTHWIAAVIGGALIGAVAAFPTVWFYSGILRLETWRGYATFGAAVIGFSVLSALVFWGTLKLLGELEPGRPGAAVASGEGA